jgi:hypothetical protein
LGGEVVELIGGLDRLTERKVTGQSFTGTIITDAAGGERHIVRSIVVAHGAFRVSERSSRCPTSRARARASSAKT